MDENPGDAQDAESLMPVAERLRAAQPTLGGVERQRIWQRLRPLIHDDKPQAEWRQTLMRSRIALVSLLACGFLVSGTGVALGLDALSGTDSAAVAQYGPGCGNNCSGVESTEGGGSNGSDSLGGGNQGDGTASSASLRQVDQVATRSTADAGLPFTGYLAIPILLVGVALVTAGILIRRRALTHGEA